MTRSLLPGILFFSLVAFFVRFADLDRRPMHHDEGNQAVRSGQLLEEGVYRYDPEDHHGPALYYLSLPAGWVTSGRDFNGTTEVTWRLIPVLFGSGLILLLWFLRDGMPKFALIAAAALTAISPAMVYYSRFYIQEMLLVFFTLGAIAAGWRYSRRPSHGWAAILGLCLALMLATKETAILAWFAMFVGLAVLLLTDKESEPWFPRPVPVRHLAVALVVAALTYVLFFTSFFTNPAGLLDSLRAYRFYLPRGLGQSLHRHPTYYYLHLLLFYDQGRGPIWSEAFVVVFAVIGGVLAWRRPATQETRLIRFLAVYAAVLTLTYSLIPHKTPWCLISFLHGMILVAGWGMAESFRRIRGNIAKVMLAIAIVAGTVHLAWLAYQANFRYPTDPSNPYAYVETSPDLLNLVRRVEDIAALAPDGQDMLIRVVTDPYNTWPIPWYLRRYPSVGYWNSFADIPPQLPLPTVLVTNPEFEEQIPPPIRDGYQAEFFGLRTNVLLLVYIRKDIWQEFLARR